MAINAQMLEGRWKEIRGQLHERWGQLTNDELDQAHGNVEQLVGTIQRKTGESRERIQDFLEQLAGHVSGATRTPGADSSSTQSAAARAQELSQQARDQAQMAAEQAIEQMRASYYGARDAVRRRPMESITTCFGIGVVTGLLVGLIIRGR